MTSPQQKTELDARWVYIEDQTRTATLQRFSDRETSMTYDLMLRELRYDRHRGNLILLGMQSAPASKNRHHNREGGLVVHLLEMYDIWKECIQPFLKNRTSEHPLLTDSNVWLAILHHDLNKVWRYRLVNYDPWTVDYHEISQSKLLGGPQTSLSILMQNGITLTPVMHNALLCSEGGYAAHQPGAMTVLAKIVYILDEMSASVVNRLRENLFWDSLVGGINEEDQIK